MTGGNILRVLIVDQTANDVEPLIDTLRSAGYGVFPKYVAGRTEFQSEIEAEEWDLVLCGTAVEGLDVAEVVRRLDEVRAGAAVIVVYDEANGDGQACVVEALQAGASDAVSRSNSVHLQLVVKREIKRLALYRAHEEASRAHIEVQERSLVLLESSRDAIAYVHQGMHVYVNASYAKTFGHENLEDLLGLPIMNMIVESQQEGFKRVLRRYSSSNADGGFFEAKCVNASGEEFQANMELTTVTYEGEECLQVIVRPLAPTVSEEEREALEQGDDALILLDVQEFLSAVESKLGETEGRTYLLLCIQIDDFDGLAQRIGIEHAEPFVLRVGNVIEDCVPARVALGKQSVCAFVLLVEADEETGSAIADQVCRRVSQNPFSGIAPASESLSVTCSIGIASVERGAGDASLFLNSAIDACRRASTSGGNRIEVWKEATTDEIIGPANSGSFVLDALENDRVRLLFQPIVSLQGDSTAIYEAYPRVLDAEGNSMDVGEVCSNVKDIDTLTKLDEWIVDVAVRMLAERQKQEDDVHLFLRLSDHALSSERVLLFLSERLRGARLAGQWLTLQISETAALEQNKNVRAFLKGLRPLGCRSAVDHVGATRNTLDHVKKLPVDYLKLDASLCRRMMDSKQAQERVAAVVQLAGTMGIQTIATGVEEASCLTLLWQHGVDLAQGHCIQEASDVLQYDFAHES